MLDPESPTRTARDDVRLVDPPRIVPGLADATGEQLAATTRGSLPAPSVPRLYDFLVVCNRLPVELHAGDGGQATWSPSPGGLVTAMEPVLRDKAAVWVGWSGHHIDDTIPVSAPPPGIGPCDLHEVGLARDEVEEYYEGFSQRDDLAALPRRRGRSGVPPAHVDDYLARQPAVRRRPPRGWRRRAPPSGCTTTSCSWCRRCCAPCDPTCGSASSCTSRSRRPSCSCSCRGAGRSSRGCSARTSSASTREGGASNFLALTDRLLGLSPRNDSVDVLDESVEGSVRRVDVGAFPISIDTAAYDELARDPEVQARAQAIREASAARDVICSASTGSTTPRASTYGSAPSRSCSPTAGRRRRRVFVQVATPSRENVEEYQRMRDEIELIGRPRSTATTAPSGTTDPVPAPAAGAGGARRVLRRVRRDARDAVPRRHEPRRQGVRRLPDSRRRRAGAQRVHRRGDRAAARRASSTRTTPTASRTPSSSPSSTSARTGMRRMNAMRDQVYSHDVERWAREFQSAGD